MKTPLTKHGEIFQLRRKGVPTTSEGSSNYVGRESETSNCLKTGGLRGPESPMFFISPLERGERLSLRSPPPSSTNTTSARGAEGSSTARGAVYLQQSDAAQEA